MGNAASASPFAEFTYAQVVEELDPQRMRKLEGWFRATFRSKPVREADFVTNLGPQLGRAGDVAARKLFNLIAAINPTGGKDGKDGKDGGGSGSGGSSGGDAASVSFEKYAVAAWVLSRSTLPQRLGVVFAMFDSRQSGSLDKSDLSSLLLVVTAASHQKGYRPGQPIGELAPPQHVGWQGIKVSNGAAAAKEQPPSQPPQPPQPSQLQQQQPPNKESAQPQPQPRQPPQQQSSRGNGPTPSPVAVAMWEAARAESSKAADGEGGSGNGGEIATGGNASGETSTSTSTSTSGGGGGGALEKEWGGAADLMASAVLARFDADRDRKLNAAEWAHFAATEHKDLCAFEARVMTLLTKPLELEG